MACSKNALSASESNASFVCGDAILTAGNNRILSDPPLMVWRPDLSQALPDDGDVNGCVPGVANHAQEDERGEGGRLILAVGAVHVVQRFGKWTPHSDVDNFFNVDK